MRRRDASIIGDRNEVGLKIHVSDPLVAEELAQALAAADCTAERTADDTLHVEMPWIQGDEDAEQAWMELHFFLRAWEARRPGFEALVSP